MAKHHGIHLLSVTPIGPLRFAPSCYTTRVRIGISRLARLAAFSPCGVPSVLAQYEHLGTVIVSTAVVTSFMATRNQAGRMSTPCDYGRDHLAVHLVYF